MATSEPSEHATLVEGVTIHWQLRRAKVKHGGELWECVSRAPRYKQSYYRVSRAGAIERFEADLTRHFGEALKADRARLKRWLGEHGGAP